MVNEEKKRFQLKAPHAYALIAIFIVLCTILTYVVPAGTYDRYVNEVGQTVVDPNSFQYVDPTPVSPFDMVRAVPTAMTNVGWIIFLVFIIGGAFGIINRTGAIEAGIAAAIKKVNGKDALLVAFLMLMFSLGGATFGMQESTMIFTPICVMVARAMGYDAIVGMAIVNVGAVVGWSAGWMNIFTVGVAQGLAELPLFSGTWYRLIVHAVILVVTVTYIMRYCKKIKANPEKSYIYDIEKIAAKEQQVASGTTMDDEKYNFTTKRKAVLIVAVIGFAVLIYGIAHGWSTGTDISALFLVMGIVCGYVGGLNTTEICDAFVDGAKGICFGALIIGLCRTMIEVLTAGQIIDTILHGTMGILDGVPPVLGAGLMVIVQTFINFFISAGSGQAMATMPIVIPLSDMMGLSRQTAVLAYQLGDGLSNSLWPTSGVLMGCLSIAGIPYTKWFKFAAKLMICLYITSVILCMISVVVGYE